MLYRSGPCLPLFSAVVKNVPSTNVEIKKLVYIFLLHHAELDPDLALLSINTIQKSLSDPDAQLRAMALRVMSGIRVPVISQIVSLAIKRGIADMSPIVRRAAALAIPKCFRLEPSTLPQLTDYIVSLLGDKQYYVAGPAVSAFLEVCPERIELIHVHYHSLVRKLVDMDEWSQLATLRLLTNYSRKCFPRKLLRRLKKATAKINATDKSTALDDGFGEEVMTLDPDLESFLKAARSLLSSRNSAVIVAAVRSLVHLGRPEDLESTIGPLVALLRASKDIQSVVLHDIVSLCQTRSDLFVKYVPRFLVKAEDEHTISKLKFEALHLIFPHCEPHIQEMILSDLEHFARSTEPHKVEESVRTIGRCAQHTEATSERCLSLLLQHISSRNGHLTAEALTVVRHLIQKHPEAHVKTVIRLAKNLDSVTDTQARASIIWLVSEQAGLADRESIAPDVLRILAKGFADEAETAKLQILLLAAKLYLQFLLRRESRRADEADDKSDDTSGLPASLGTGQPSTDSSTHGSSVTLDDDDEDHPIPILWQYVLHMIRYDTSYDLRDRARFYSALLEDPNMTQLATLVLLAPKPVPKDESSFAKHHHLLMGSSSLVLGTDAVLGYDDLPPWVQEGSEPDASLRNEATTVGVPSRTAKAMPAATVLDQALREKDLEVPIPSSKGKNLEDWLDEESDSEEEEGSTEYETESEEGSEEGVEYVTDSESEGEPGERQKLVS